MKRTSTKSRKNKVGKESKRGLRMPDFPELPFRSKIGRATIRKAVLAVIKARTAKSGAPGK